MSAPRCRMPHVHGVSSFSAMVLVVLWSVCPVRQGCCLAPDGLNSRTPMLARPPHRGETSSTTWGVGSRHVNPSPPEHRVMGYTWSCPPPRAITRRRTRCQSYEKDERATHMYRSKPNGPPSTVIRSRWAGTKPYGLDTGPTAGHCGRGRRTGKH